MRPLGVYGPKGEQVANLHVPMLPYDEHRANARLMAEAPAMLAALQYASATLRESAKQHRLQGDGTGHGEACERARDEVLAILDRVGEV